MKKFYTWFLATLLILTCGFGITEMPETESEVNNMPNIPQVKVGTTTYNLKDAEARKQVNDLSGVLNIFLISDIIITCNANNGYDNWFFNNIYLEAGTYTVSCEQSARFDSATRNRFKYRKAAQGSSAVYEPPYGGQDRLAAGTHSFTFTVDESTNYHVGMWVSGVVGEATFSHFTLSRVNDVYKNIFKQNIDYYEPFIISGGDHELLVNSGEERTLSLFDSDIYLLPGRYYVSTYQDKTLVSTTRNIFKLEKIENGAVVSTKWEASLTANRLEKGIHEAAFFIGEEGTYRFSKWVANPSENVRFSKFFLTRTNRKTSLTNIDNINVYMRMKTGDQPDGRINSFRTTNGNVLSICHWPTIYYQDVNGGFNSYTCTYYQMLQLFPDRISGSSSDFLFYMEPNSALLFDKIEATLVYNADIVRTVDPSRYIILAEIDSNGYFSQGAFKRFMIEDKMPYKLSLHRGGFTNPTIPENTYPSFWLGCQFGADLFEIDVRESSDGVLVLSHTTYLEGTVNGQAERWEVSEHTYAELQTLVLSHDNIFGDIHVMTLSECFDLIGKYGVVANLDIKTFSQIKCAQLAVSKGMSGRVAYNINVYEEGGTFQDLKRTDPQAKIVVGYHPTVWEEYTTAGFKNGEIIIWVYDYEMTQEIANNVHSHGYNLQIDIVTANNLPSYIDAYHPDIIETGDTKMVTLLDAMVACRNARDVLHVQSD